MKNTNSNNIFILLIISLFIHLFILVVWLFVKPEQLASISSRHISITIQDKSSNLKQQEIAKEVVPDKVREVVEPKLEKEEKNNKRAPLPDPNLLPNTYSFGEEVESTNQEDKAVTDVKVGSNVATEIAKEARQVGGGVITSDFESVSENVQGSSKEDEILRDFGGVYNTFTGYDDETNESQGEEERGFKSSKENASDDRFATDSEAIGNYSLLSDAELDNAFVKDPFSEKRGKELKLINIYFKQISDVIFSNWSNPLSPSEIKDGASIRIKFQLNESGFIDEPSLQLQSRYPKLDRSLLSAIKDSMTYQFEIPRSYLEKYGYLTLSWSSDGSEYELMPFQEETEKEK